MKLKKLKKRLKRRSESYHFNQIILTIQPKRRR
nr:MAG TPA: hypothetical protein [Caudoviricetes sp.]